MQGPAEPSKPEPARGVIRALSLRQPFAWLTLHGKNPENRTWNTSFRGWFLIHASAQWTGRDERLAFEMVRRLPEPQATEYHRNLVAALRNGMQVGGIVGAARLESIQQPAKPLGPWRLPEQYGYVLAAVTPVAFVPCKGLQRFWRVKPEAAELLRLRLPPWLWQELQKND